MSNLLRLGCCRPRRMVSGLALAVVVLGCYQSVIAQSPTSGFPTANGNSPDVIILPPEAEPTFPSGTSNSGLPRERNSRKPTTLTPVPATPIPPMPIGPAPEFRPAPMFRTVPVYGFDGRPIYPTAPRYGSSFYPAPAYRGPAYGGPVPVYGGSILRNDVGSGPVLLPPHSVPWSANYVPTPAVPNSGPTPLEQRRPAGPANFRLTVSESLLNCLVGKERIEPGPVQDVILGAQVTGHQTTVSRMRADFVPSLDKARVALVLNGDVQSLTTGVTPQAKIDTAGQQQFYAVKEVYFDGIQLTTRHATVYIRARNQTIGAMTTLSGSLFGGLADRIAYRTAERQKSAGEAVARDKLAERLFPTFDGEVDTRLAQGNRQLQPLRKWLSSVELLPSSQSVWTTDTQLIHEGYVGDDKVASSVAPVPDPAEGDHGAQLAIHDSLINTLIDRTGLKGLKTTDKKLRELEKSFLSLAGQQPDEGDDLENSEPSGGTQPAIGVNTEGFVTDIEFDDAEPLVVRMERDEMIVTIKAHFKPAGQAVVPPMSVTIPYHTELIGPKIRLVPGAARVVAQDRIDPSGPPTIVETMIQKVIEAELIPLEFDRALPAALWSAASPAPQVTSIKSANGWLTITAK